MRSVVIIAALTTIGVVGAVPTTAAASDPPNTYFAAASGGAGTGSDCPSTAPCTLAHAISAAGGDLQGTPTVELESGTYRNVALEIQEPMGLTAADGDVTPPVLEGTGGAAVIAVETSMTGITGIRVGGGTDGLYVASGSPGVVTDSSFNDNTNDGINDVGGGGIENYVGVTADGNGGSGLSLAGAAAVEVLDSTFSNNGVDGMLVGAVDNGNSPVVAANNSTFWGNDANGVTAVNEGSAVLSYSTVVNNGEHGLYTDNDGLIKIGADILADNGGNDPSQDCANGSSQPSPIVTDAGYNIVDDGTCPIGSASVEDTSAAFHDSIGTLGNYGGPTETVAITSTSPAAALAAAAPTGMPDLCGSGQKDQRGLIRPADPCAAGSFDPHATTLDSTLALGADPEVGAVHGDTITLTATVSGSAGGSSGGTVEFDAGPTGGALSQITSCNQDAVAVIPVVDGVAVCRISAVPGDYHFSATFSGSQTYNPSGPATVSSYAVKYFSTTTVVVDSASLLSVTVEPDPAATGVALPTGDVTFMVDGTAVGTPQPLDDTETASSTLDPPLSGAHTISAVYAGDANYGGSTDSTETTNPTITASLSSKAAKTRAGWWRDAVVVSFNCTKGSADLDGSCPAPVTLSASRANQTVHRTITDSDGGTASVTSKPANIDRVKPTVKISGVINRHTYPKGTKVHPRCVAKDALSGLAGPCKLTVTHHKKARRIVYAASASATDKAGNREVRPIHWDIKTQK